MYFAKTVKSGGLGKFAHTRDLVPVDRQTVIRMNRDTLYSSAVIDLDAGPATVTLPDAGARFLSAQAIDQDHYSVSVIYGAGAHTFTREEVGTRYLLLLVRILVDPAKEGDLAAVRKLQDRLKLSQRRRGAFEIPAWDPVSHKQVRDALLSLAKTMPDFSRAFGSKSEVDPIQHLAATAGGWGGNPARDAAYFSYSPEKNDGETVHRLHVPADIPADGFWSVSRYNADGYFAKNDLNAYSLNNLTAAKDADGAIVVQFGGCDGSVPNCLPIDKGWTYTVRLYRPHTEVLDGSWKFPEAKAMER
jgi:hypothetical protein